MREKHPDVGISEILAYSSIEPYEVNDEGCWLTQQRVDKFYEKAVELSGNENTA